MVFSMAAQGRLITEVQQSWVVHTHNLKKLLPAGDTYCNILRPSPWGFRHKICLVGFSQLRPADAGYLSGFKHICHQCSDCDRPSGEAAASVALHTNVLQSPPFANDIQIPGC